MLKEIGAIEAIINKIQSIKDGSVRITLDIPQDQAEIIGELMKIAISPKPLIYVGFSKLEERKENGIRKFTT